MEFFWGHSFTQSLASFREDNLFFDHEQLGSSHWKDLIVMSGISHYSSSASKVLTGKQYHPFDLRIHTGFADVAQDASRAPE